MIIMLDKKFADVASSCIWLYHPSVFEKVANFFPLSNIWLKSNEKNLAHPKGLEFTLSTLLTKMKSSHPVVGLVA